MTNPEGFNVLPGMTATVFAEFLPGEGDEEVSVNLPHAAVVADTDKESTVWLVDETSMTVSPRKVELGLITDKSIAVIGLYPGERVVTAGAAFLRDGMKVTLLETGEQPE